MNPKEKEQLEQRMKLLLDGKAESDNEYVNYALEKMREGLSEKNLVMQGIDRARKSLTQMETRLVELGAEFQKYADDIEHFDEGVKKIKEKYAALGKKEQKPGKENHDGKVVDIS